MSESEIADEHHLGCSRLGGRFKSHGGNCAYPDAIYTDEVAERRRVARELAALRGESSAPRGTTPELENATMASAAMGPGEREDQMTTPTEPAEQCPFCGAPEIGSEHTGIGCPECLASPDEVNRSLFGIAPNDEGKSR